MSRPAYLGLIGALLLSGVFPASAGQARIESDQGRVSARFESAELPEVLDEIRRALRLDIILPASVGQQTITFSTPEVSVEQFLGRLMEALGLGGYALIEEPEGAGGRVIVLQRSSRVTSVPVGKDVTGSGQPDPPAGGPVLGPPAPPSVIAPPTTPSAHAPPVVRVEPGGLVFLPQGSYDLLVLKVSGPGGLGIHRDFPAGGPTLFQAVDEQGNPLPDGSYKYEIIVAPQLSQEIRQRMHVVSDSPEERSRFVAQLMKQGWLPATPVVRSGSFSIANGRVVVSPERASDRDD